MDVIQAFFRRKGNYIGKHKKKSLNIFSCKYTCTQNEHKNLFSRLVTIQYHKGFFLQIIESIERSRKNINEKELQKNKKMELRTWYFPFPLHCIVNKSTHFLRNYLTNEKRFTVLFPFYQQYSKYRELLRFSFSDLSC